MGLLFGYETKIQAATTPDDVIDTKSVWEASLTLFHLG
jgi:hypothetical protein